MFLSSPRPVRLFLFANAEHADVTAARTGPRIIVAGDQARFHQAAADGNLDALRALRHKLHSALTQLRLEALRVAFYAFLEAPDQETARALTAHELDRAAASLQQAAARENPSDRLPPPQ